MPNDVPDYTGQQKVNLVGGVSGFDLGDVGAGVQAADSATETINATLGVTSSTAALASFKPLTAPALVKAGSVLTGTTGAVNPAYGAAPGVGNLLVAVVTAYAAAPTTVTAGWALVVDSNPGGGGTHCAIFSKPNSAGGDAAPAFTGGLGPGLMQAVLLEFSGPVIASPTDQTGGVFQGGAGASIAVTASAVDAVGQDLVVLGAAWRNGTIAFTGTFADAFNNQATVTHAADNGSVSQQDHLSVAFAVVAGLPAVLPVGEQVWPYDVTGTNAPAAGSAASVVLAATPGKAYTCASITAGMIAQIANVGIGVGLQLLDGATVIWEQFLSVGAAALAVDHIEKQPVAFKGTIGNSMTLKFTAGGANVIQVVSIGAYLR